MALANLWPWPGSWLALGDQPNLLGEQAQDQAQGHSLARSVGLTPPSCNAQTGTVSG